MLLLRSIKIYAIMVDYFMYNARTNTDYTQSVYLTIDMETKDKAGNILKLITFKEEITPNLRIFRDKNEAASYMDEHLKNSCFCENARVVESRYSDNGFVIQ